LQVAAKLEAQILPGNKQVVFDALAAARIAVVNVTFDGSGDSGQFEELVGFTAENEEVEVPNDTIEIETVEFDSGLVSRGTTTVREFIEKLACDFLEATHSGWEDGEGAYGEFRFTLADRTITLEYNERYVDYHYHEHQF
jgi:hypothetical protein